MPLAASLRRMRQAPVPFSTARSPSHTRTRPNPLHHGLVQLSNTPTADDARGNGAKTMMAIRGPLRSRSRQPSLPCHQTPRSNDRTRQVPPSMPACASFRRIHRALEGAAAIARSQSHARKRLHHLTALKLTQHDVQWLPNPAARRNDTKIKLAVDSTKSGSEINESLAAARVADSTPPFHDGRSTDKRGRRSEWYTSKSLQPHVARKAPEHSNLPPTICPRSRRIQSAYMRSTTDASPQSNTWELKLSPYTSRVNDSRKEDFHYLPKTADVRVSKSTSKTMREILTSAQLKATKSSKPGSMCEDSLPRDAEVRPASQPHSPKTVTHTISPPTAKRVSDRRNITLTDNGTPSLSPHHAFDPGLAGRPMKGKCARREVRYLGYQRLMKSNEATAKTTAFGMRGFEAMSEQTTKATAVPEASTSRARRPTKAFRRWEAPTTQDSRGDGGRHGAMGRVTTTALATSAQ
ncbi:hypothetical protein D9611_009982 [Ephemerocybe angulata]|uniref:Uncharacterized protein n=1 Tax=Ephemerocybe angulata TaxID=980116 RepID=A0A8H5FF74_9AGAR|nr:hypothetical protein D9611_009982 [Tulosesus angulatus]